LPERDRDVVLDARELLGSAEVAEESWSCNDNEA